MDDTSGRKMELRVEKHKNKTIITPLMNEITFKNSMAFLDEVKLIADDKPGDIILNMEHIDLIDSISLGTLVTIKKYVKTRQGEISIANISGLIQELFNLLNFPAVFKIYGSVEKALEKD